LDQPKVSALINGRLAGFSSDRLLRCLAALGQDVEIIIRAVPRGGSAGGFVSSKRRCEKMMRTNAR
jgi:hypothetical protein